MSPIDVSILSLEAWHVISSRTRNCLGYLNDPKDAGSTVAKIPIEQMRLSDLSHVSRLDMVRLPNLGQACYCEIAVVMDRYGWRFHDRWTGQSEPPALDLLGTPLPRVLRKTAQAMEVRKARFALGQEMLKLHDGGLSLTEIGNRFGVTGSAVRVTIQKTRQVLEARTQLPICAPPLPC